MSNTFIEGFGCKFFCQFACQIFIRKCVPDMYLILERSWLYLNTISYLENIANKKRGLMFWNTYLLTSTMGCFIYILDSSNSSSFAFWTSQFTSSSKCNWTGISSGNSNGSWTDKHSSHISKVKEMSVKVPFFFM